MRQLYKIAYHGFMEEFKDYENTQGLEELEGWRYFPIRAANRIKSFWESNRVLSYLRRHRLKQTMIISYALLGLWYGQLQLHIYLQLELLI